MHVIYKIKFPNQKVYIGQTNNLQKRINDHLREAKTGSDSKVYRAMRKYSITKNDFEIIEDGIETKDDANSREIYWISQYDSFKNGYNSTQGGDNISESMKEENNPRALLTNEEVIQIRILKSQMIYSKQEIYNKYQNRISIYGFHKIWNYESFPEIGKELNTENVINFYKTYSTTGSSNKKCIFSKDDVIDIRNAYYIDLKSSKELSQIYNCHESTLSRLISGKTYTDIQMPEPSFAYKRKNHIFNVDEIDIFINNFIKSNVNIKDFWKSIKDDTSNLFGGFSESQFRKFISKELKIRGYQYIAYNKWKFEITKL